MKNKQNLDSNVEHYLLNIFVRKHSFSIENKNLTCFNSKNWCRRVNFRSSNTFKKNFFYRWNILFHKTHLLKKNLYKFSIDIYTQIINELEIFLEAISKHVTHFKIQNAIIQQIQNVTSCNFDDEETISQMKSTSTIFNINADRSKIERHRSIFLFWRRLFSYIHWKYNEPENKYKKIEKWCCILKKLRQYEVKNQTINWKKIWKNKTTKNNFAEKTRTFAKKVSQIDVCHTFFENTFRFIK